MTAAATPATALVVPRNDPVILGYREQAQEIARVADALVVDSEPRKAEAVELAARIAGLLRAGEAKRHELVDGPGTYVRQTDALFREVLGPVKIADDTIRAKVRAFQREQERRAAEAAAQAEAERLAAAARLRAAEAAEAAAVAAREQAARAEAAGQTAVAETARAEAAGQAAAAEQLLQSAVASETTARDAQAQAVLPSRSLQTASGSASVRRDWTFELVDLDLVPTEYVVLNERKVREAIRAGVRAISGLRIFQDVNIAIKGA